MPDSGAPAEVYDLYQAGLREHGFDPAQFRTMTNRVIYVCDDPEAGWNDVKQHYLYVFNVYRDWSPRPATSPSSARRSTTRTSSHATSTWSAPPR